MIASFFQRLESLRVEYLLISGQATILYGAATFSEDVDLWVLPTDKNLEHFVSALRSVAATYYKLTPPLTVENLERGHGFHFALPGGPSGDVYLDVMGRPPRVGSFESAATGARIFDTDFGRVRTIKALPPRRWRTTSTASSKARATSSASRIGAIGHPSSTSSDSFGDRER